MKQQPQAQQQQQQKCKLSVEMDIEDGLRIVGSHDLRSGSKQIDRFLWLRKIFLLAIIFSASFTTIALLFTSLLRLDDHNPSSISHWDDHALNHIHNLRLITFKLPSNVDELRSFRDALSKYQEQHRFLVQLVISCLYLFLQAFMLPGSIFLNLLAGSFYGFYHALLLVTVLASLGSSLCYMLSWFILKDIVYYYYPERCEWLANEVHCHRHNLLNYVLFLRITPLLPNWFINVSAPLVAVPFREFLLGTFVGVIPAGVVAVKAGRILSQLNSLNDLYDVHTLAALFVLAFLVILPVLLKRRVARGAKAT